MCFTFYHSTGLKLALGDQKSRFPVTVPFSRGLYLVGAVPANVPGLKIGLRLFIGVQLLAIGLDDYQTIKSNYIFVLNEVLE